MAIRYGLCVFVCAVTFFLGCASPSKCVKVFLGISVENLRDQKEGRYSAGFTAPYNEIYSKTLSAVKNMNTEVFVEDKKNRCIGASKFDAVYPYCLKTTEVGIFFEYKDQSLTKIDVVSKNYKLAEFVFEKICAELGKSKG